MLKQHEHAIAWPYRRSGRIEFTMITGYPLENVTDTRRCQLSDPGTSGQDKSPKTRRKKEDVPGEK